MRVGRPLMYGSDHDSHHRRIMEHDVPVVAPVGSERLAAETGSKVLDRNRGRNQQGDGLRQAKPLARPGNPAAVATMAAVFWIAWITATALGWAVGWAIGSGFANEAFGGPISAGVGGSVAGIAQGIVLVRAGYPWGVRWALVTVGAVVAGTAVGLGATIAAGGVLPPAAVGVPVMVILTIGGQWWVLKGHVSRAGWWPLAVVAGFVAAGTVVAVIRSVIGIPLGSSGSLVWGAIGGALLGTTQGTITGAVLVRAMRIGRVGAVVR